MSVTKRDEHDYAWISTTLPEEAEKLRKEKIYMDSEVFVPKFAPQGKLSEDDKTRKNALILMVHDLNKIKQPRELEKAIRIAIGDDKIILICFNLTMENIRDLAT